MNRKATGIITLIAVAMILIVPLSSISSDGDETQGGRFMLDEGNGAKTWFDAAKGDTYSDVIRETLEANGHTCTISGASITVDGKTTNTVGTGSGSSSDVIKIPGSSTIKVISKWIPYEWNDGKNRWDVVADLSAPYSSSHIAIGFYPEGIVPSETPYNQSVTCMGYDAKASNSQTAIISEDGPKVNWAELGWDGVTYGSITDANTSTGMGSDGATYTGAYAQVLIAGGYAFIKYGLDNDRSGTAALVCRDIATGAVKWFFKYPRAYYETSNFIIVGDHVIVQSSSGLEGETTNSVGSIYKINWRTSSGLATPEKTLTGIPGTLTDYPAAGYDSYAGASGVTSLVYDSGAIFSLGSNGMVYCFDFDLNPVWSYHTNGRAYYSAPVVYNNLLFAGMLDGHLYILDKNLGTLKTDIEVYQADYKGDIIGSVTMPSIVESDGKYYIFCTFSDGRGMSAQLYGNALYEYDGESDVKTIVEPKDRGYGSLGRMTAVETGDFKGVYFEGNKKLFRMNLNGNISILNKDVNTSHSYLVLINGDKLAATSYTKGTALMEFDLEGNIIGKYLEDEKYQHYCMAGLTVFNGGFIYGNDSSVISIRGGFGDGSPDPIPEQGLAPWQILLIVLGALAIILTLAYVGMRYGLKWEHPWNHIVSSINNFLFGEEYSHNTLSRHRLWLVMGIGLTLTLIAAIASLCIGPTTTLGVGEMFQNLFSAIGKGGNNLTYNELMVYSARLPRTLVAIAVGVGLSVAGAMYQAIIRNPLVDPYIMGVSSGAGTAAIAVISFDFTFFGLFPAHSIYLTAFTAAVGGILAFMCTMLLATKAGGTSINYVLSGVIVGLVFSAAQTLMLTFAGNHVTGALSWLYGSFSEITWSKVWLVLIPSFAMSFAVLFWAKEFNLVLLGEDQARQMGLNVKRFNRWMLIIASVLTSICVAFVGIIGFVGLVIPHLCRMMLGGDHRLVLPTSMAFGGFLMIVADIASRMLVPGFELPVGAITTIIGVPVFAYLLIKRGKMYDG